MSSQSCSLDLYVPLKLLIYQTCKSMLDPDVLQLQNGDLISRTTSAHAPLQVLVKVPLARLLDRLRWTRCVDVKLEQESWFQPCSSHPVEVFQLKEVLGRGVRSVRVGTLRS